MDLFSALKYLKMNHPDLKSARAWNRMVRNISTQNQPVDLDPQGTPQEGNAIEGWINMLMIRRTKADVASNNEKKKRNHHLKMNMILKKRMKECSKQKTLKNRMNPIYQDH